MIQRNKRRFVCLMILILLAGMFLPMAQAGEYFTKERQIDYAQACLTEVRGYLAEEADQFVFEHSEKDGIATVRYWHPDFPDWVYTLQFSLADGKLISNDSPFQSDFQGYPGENSVRYIIAQVQKQGLLKNWNKASREGFRAILEQDGLTPSAELDKGLLSATYTPQQALKDFFATCYGAQEQWPAAVGEWYQWLLNAYQLTEPQQSAAHEGVTRYRSSTEHAFVLSEFTDAAPPELAEVFRHPMLEGWQVLSGAMVVYEERSLDENYGLVAFGRGEKRLLCILRQSKKDDTWEILPASETLLPDGCVPVISRKKALSEMGGREYVIRFEQLDTPGMEEVTLVMQIVISAGGHYARLKECSFYDAVQGIHYQAQFAYGECTVHMTDRENERYDTSIRGNCFYTDLVMALQLDSLLAGIVNPEKADGFVLPASSIMTGSVHLRKESSSHSKDLGMLSNGTIALNLGTETGDPYPWYHVRVGGLEGYVSSVYTSETPGNLLTTPTPVAMAKEELSLRQQSSWFATKTAVVEKGATMHIILERKGWYYVCVPREQPAGLWMDPEGTFGFVRANQVDVGNSAMELAWRKGQ